MSELQTFEVSIILEWNNFLASSRFSIDDLYSSTANEKLLGSTCTLQVYNVIQFVIYFDNAMQCTH